MLPPVFAPLKTSAAVKAIVGTNPPRIYAHGDAPPHDERVAQVPYITWQVISSAPENQLSGTPTTDHDIVQINCWHPTAQGVRLLAIAARDACEPVAHQTGMPVDQRDVETRLFWIALQFDWFDDRES
jgi:hypothetical protein